MQHSPERILKLRPSPHDPRQDRSLKYIADDLLDRGPFVESLVRALVRDKLNSNGRVIGRRSTGYVIGLTGKWGLGKSSVLSFVEQELAKKPFVSVAMFNPWLFNGRDELLNGFFNALRDALGKSKTEKVQDLRNELDNYWSALSFAGDGLALAADINGGSGCISAIWKTIKNHWPGKAPVRSPADERKSLEGKLLASEHAVVVLIDELDRVEDSDVRAVAQLVKAVGDIRGISYLVAYDSARVADALGRGKGKTRRARGEQYLEKIIQHPIPLRPLFSEDVDKLLNAALSANEVELPEQLNDQQQRILQIIRKHISTPREVKRLIGTFDVIHAAVRGELCPLDTLAYCWVLTKSPALRELIAANPDTLVDDPKESEMSARFTERYEGSPAPTPVELLGPAASMHEEVLTLLFPRFGTERNTSEDQSSRISRRRNLIRLLYLGNPPTMVSRSEIERIWSIKSADILDTELERLNQSGLIFEFMDRLDDLVASLPTSGHTTFWLAVSRLVTRTTDWVNGPETSHSILEEAGTILLNLAVRNKGALPVARAAVCDLIASGDLALAPFILRKHLFHFGMTVHSSRERDDPLIFDLDEMKTLIPKEAARYRTSILSGYALRRLPSLSIVFYLSNQALWDDELKDSLTEQLSSPESIATFAALIMPPGYMIERTALDELLHIDILSGHYTHGYSPPSHD